MYIVYPSCNFIKFFPDTAERIRAYLNTQDAIMIAGCCHLTNDIPKDGDIIVTICMSCMRGLDEIRPDIPQISFFEFMLTRNDFQWPDLQGEEITIQDCFRARGKHMLQDSARACLKLCNAVPVEMDNNRDEETFDGNFLFHDPYPINMKEAPRYFSEYLPQHINVIPENEWPQALSKHAALYRTRRVACYCNTCTMGARSGRADAVHLASILFD